MRRPSVLIADDHTIVAEGLVKLLSERFDVVATVADGTALDRGSGAPAPRHHHHGSEHAFRRRAGGDWSGSRSAVLSSKFVILTMHKEAIVAAKAMRAGASAFLLKVSAGEELIDAIDEVLNGRTYLSPAVTKDVLAAFDQPAW